jgi:putative phosphoribosyl transferase
MNMLPIFADRTEAAEMLAAQLHAYRGQNPLILAIPRGGLPIADLLAKRLLGELDIVLVHKLGAPFNEEYAIGAIDETGWSSLTPFATHAGISPAYVEAEKSRQLDKLKKRREQMRPYRPLINPQGRIVIIVDDGIATGATMRAALQAIRSKHPAELVCAIPVAAPDSLDELATLADRIVCLAAPAYFQGVGQFYRTFPQVTDKEALYILAHHDAGERSIRKENHPRSLP